MPFTFTHPAATLPLFKWSRRKDLLLPLAIGSMMPDFGYYFAPLPIFHENAHTLIKSFTFCLPIGFLTFALVMFLKNGLLNLLPENKSKTIFYDHLPEKITVKFVVIAAVAIILGTWTHIVWDAFTHKNGFLVNMIPFLNFEVIPKVQIFRILQHVSTLIGAWFLFRFYRDYPVSSGEWNKRALKIITIANIFSLAFAFKISPFQWFYFITAFFKMFILISICAAFVFQRKNSLT